MYQFFLDHTSVTFRFPISRIHSVLVQTFLLALAGHFKNDGRTEGKLAFDVENDDGPKKLCVLEDDHRLLAFLCHHSLVTPIRCKL